jgi:hypothetical protein
MLTHRAHRQMVDGVPVAMPASDVPVGIVLEATAAQEEDV